MTDLELTVVENLNNMFPNKNYQSKVVKYPNMIIILWLMCVCAACVYNTFIAFIQTINMISKSKF
jgi:hypothetical protein